MVKVIQINNIIQPDDVKSKWQQPIGLLYTSIWTDSTLDVNTNIQNT